MVKRERKSSLYEIQTNFDHGSRGSIPRSVSSPDLLAGLSGFGATGLLGLMVNQNAPVERQEQ
ncbi:hypothetical protein MesoLjLb_22520 [Mesorhizobium sp. L-8-3]|nr:hypothetical protein MesoLjLb_22520 [Mesorhizobium sp. L-8-3]